MALMIWPPVPDYTKLFEYNTKGNPRRMQLHAQQASARARFNGLALDELWDKIRWQPETLLVAPYEQPLDH